MSTSGWFTTSPLWTSDHHKSNLLQDNTTEPIPHVKLEDVIAKTTKFPIKFPIESIKCHQLIQQKIPEDKLERNINSTYPVMHEHALHLCSTFLSYQKKHGNRSFYRNMTLLQLIDRLLSKRAVSFVGRHDHYHLRDGTENAGSWETIGTRQEKPPLVLEDYLSYNEVKLAAFLSVSSHTCFINDGNRRNCGVFEENRAKVEEDGVIIGLIGTRLHKETVMECMEVMKTKQQNRRKYGFGKTWTPTLQSKVMSFYGDNSDTYDSLVKQMKETPERYVQLMKGRYFDTLVYARRMALSIDTLLIEANDRAKKQNKMAYVHVVGLGLGVWKIYGEQDKLFMDTFAERLQLLSGVLSNTSDVCFAYIKHKMAAEYKDGDRLQHIKLHFVDRNPHERLVEEDEGKLLVVSYAWDANALPGNEFWWGSLNTSSDPAAASSTQVAELHNSHINDRVSGRNLRVVTLGGLVTFGEYQQLHKDD